jgi:hypothetical protein
MENHFEKILAGQTFSKVKMKIILKTALFSCICITLTECKYDKFRPPKSNFTDRQLYDSCKNNAALIYYQNDSVTIHSGDNGPHGAFKLKFNKIAALALTDGGKLPVGNVFPDGSLIVKEVQSNGLLAFMHKHKSFWLWGEANADGSTVFSIDSDPTTACVNCHSQNGERDLAVSFHHY